MRIAKYIADSGLCSRREAERWIEDGRVEVDGEILASPALNVEENNLVKVDGKLISAAPPPKLWVYYKPLGLITTHDDPQGRPTIFEQLKKLPRVISVGRLDINSEGILLLTNNGELSRYLEKPSNKVERVYKVRVYGRGREIDIEKYPWVLVHDAARPCVTHDDIDKIIEQCIENNCGGLLAAQVVDTIKKNSQVNSHTVGSTIDRSNLWHAFTPQMYKTVELKQAIEQALEQGLQITDESSAIELAGLPSLLVLGRRDNIKITRPEDIALATFYLDQQKQAQQKLKQQKLEQLIG